MAAIAAAAIGAVGALGGAAISASNRPKSSQTATTQQVLRPEVATTLDQLQQKSREFAAQPYTPYTGQRLANFTPEQLQAFGLTGDIAATSGGLYGLTEQQTLNAIDQSGVPLSRALAQGSASMVPGSMEMLPGQTAAAGTSGALANLGTGIAGEGVGQTLNLAQTLPNVDLSGYMNPYTQAVLDPTLRDLYERSAQQQNAEKARQARTGSFGGSRGAITSTELERGTEREAGRLSALERSNAFTNAVQQFRADQNAIPSLYGKALDMTGTAQGQQRAAIDAITAALQGRSLTQGQIAAAQGALANVAGLENVDLSRLSSLSAANAARLQTEVNPLSAVGAQIQAQEQAQRDIDYQNFIEQRDWGARGLSALNQAAATGSGLGSSSIQTTPLNTGNRTAQILGGAMMGGSLFSNPTLSKSISGLFSGGSNTGSNAVSDSGYASLYNSGGIDTSYGPQMP